MNTEEPFEIAPLEMAIILMSIIIGVGILTIPRGLTSALETADGWISIAITGVLSMLLIYLYVRLQQHYPGQSFMGFLQQGKAGRVVASFLTLGFLVYFISLLAFEARVLSLVVKMYLLDRTPSEVLAAIILLTTTYAVTKGIQGVVHLSLLFMPIIFILAITLLIANGPNIDLDRILPVLGEGIAPVFKGVSEISLSFLGIEVLLFWMTYMKSSSIRALPLNISIGIITIIYIFTFIIVVSIFGVDGTQTITFPTVEAVKEIELPGAFFERLESLMITIWIMTIFNTMSIAQLITYQLITHTFSFKKNNTVLASIFFVTFIVAFIPNSLSELFTFADWIGWLGVSLILSSIIIGHFTIWLRKQKNNQMTRGI
ncbi:GerAB/ArcD/ProY family transporter [Alkalihalobacterium sp. APHAB7]|uniref:GerAB/ArcD/ProY family transporter n=1 Tax=Alkalihalobacterium sp. APHAB7 TaxID=3402081 RepID=UPI003AAFFB6B